MTVAASAPRPVRTSTSTSRSRSSAATSYAELLSLGWNPPTSLPPELRPPGVPSDAGSPNFYVDQRRAARPSTLARLAVRTLRKVYHTKHPSDLEYRAFHRSGERIRLPLAFTDPAPAPAAPDLTGVPLMLEAAHDAFPTALLQVGKDGVVVESEAGPLSIAPQADGVLGIWAPVLGAPDPAPEVYEALNIANIWLDGAKVVAVRDELFLVVELLPGWISREALRHALLSAATQMVVARERVLATLADMQFAGAEGRARHRSGVQRPLRSTRAYRAASQILATARSTLTGVAAALWRPG